MKQDALTKLREDLPREKQRLKHLKDVSLQELQEELASTVVSCLQETVEQVFLFRHWAAHAHQAHADSLDSHEERLEVLESMIFGGDSQLTSEDAVLFSKIAYALQGFVEQAKEQTTDEEGQSKLAELDALCRAAQQRIAAIEVSEGDDEEGEQVSGEAEDASEAAATA